MSAREERRKQARALGAYLKTLHDDVLTDALAELGIARDPETADAPPRLCRVCGKVFPVCRRLWADDHDFEAPRRPHAIATAVPAVMPPSAQGAVGAT